MLFSEISYRGITKQVNSLLDSNLKKLATMLCKYKVIWRQKNQGSVHILHNHRGGSLKYFCMIMGMGRGLALWWHKLEQLLRQSDFFKQLLVQNDLIFNLWMKWMKAVFGTTFFRGNVCVYVCVCVCVCVCVGGGGG